MKKAAVIFLNPPSFLTALAIRDFLGDAILHGPAGQGMEGDVFFSDLTGHVRTLFTEAVPIVAVCASGILIRALSGLPCSKEIEPPVLSVAADGSFVVPLLGGHHGANELARRIALALGGVAAITTASDICFNITLDEPPPGWTLRNPGSVKQVLAGLLKGESLRLEGEAEWISSSNLPLGEKGTLSALVTLYQGKGEDDNLIYHPHLLTLGVGCARGTSAQELKDLVASVLDEYALAPEAIALVISLDLKADEPAVHALADWLKKPARFATAEDLRLEEGRLSSPSEVVRRAVGLAGVAEAAALFAAGKGGTLLVAKRKSVRATCALAKAVSPVNPVSVGRARGKLALVGIGPGLLDWMTGEALAVLREAEEWVGYGFYLDQISGLRRGQREHRFPLGAEMERARCALELAALGRNVALVSSGDPGIYGMAAVVYELLDKALVSDAAQRTNLVVVPGISAFQAAAARSGAPIGHDTCLISLSDLLVPWEAIEKRLEAAAQGDFVTVLYNPRSQRRKTGLERAMAILASHRLPETPVIIASQLGRSGESVRTTNIASFDPEQVDMFTVLIVGSSTTRSMDSTNGSLRIYTPRGYGNKKDESL